jgi:hypothetical protein
MQSFVHSGTNSTEYHLTGDLDKVLAAIGQIFAEYHPLGYGTRVRRLELKDGAYQATITRANSCE